jgi:outer membrane protein, heavy metal efflux system
MIQAARARVRAAQGLRATAGRLGNPIVTYQVDNAGFPAASGVPGIDRETMTMLTLPLEPFYQRGARITQANATVRAATAEAERDEQRTALEATHAFYRAALAHVTVTTNRELVAWLDSVVAYNRARVTEGVTAESDLLRSTLERDRAAADATMADVELVQARAQLASFLGDLSTQWESPIRAGDAPLAIPRTSGLATSSTELSSSVERQSPTALRADVRAARERLAAAAADISSERRMLFREIGATLGSKQTMGTTSMIAGLSLPIPLFNQNGGEVARATAERDAALFEFTNQERIASAELIGAEEGTRLLTERATALSLGGTDSFLSRADRARRIALAAYREGAVPLLQVIDAARTWGDVRLTYYRTLYAQHESVLGLVVARGGDLFSTIPAPAPAAPNR